MGFFRLRHGVVAAAVCVGLAVPAAQTAVLRVDADAAEGGDGRTWSGAYKYLREALASARPGDEIWVAAGVYRPDQGSGVTPGNRSATFALKNGVGIYGGFQGVTPAPEDLPEGEVERDQRNPDPETNETVLSGDLGGDDGPEFIASFAACFSAAGHAYPAGCEPFDYDGDGDVDRDDRSRFLASNHYGDNSLHVVTGTNTDVTAVLDGFTITAGVADGTQPDNDGAGLRLVSGGVTLADCVFSGNAAADAGGAIRSSGSRPLVVTRCIFRGNVADWAGAFECTSSDPVLTDSVFASNASAYWGGAVSLPGTRFFISRCGFFGNVAGESGGAVFSYGVDGTLNGCIFAGNRAYGYGGAMIQKAGKATLEACHFRDNSAAQGGAVANWHGPQATIVNCLFAGNSADSGGAVYNGADTAMVLVNSTLYGNAAAADGGAVIFAPTSVAPSGVIENCILWKNTAGGGMQIALKDAPAGSRMRVGSSDVFAGRAAITAPANWLIEWGADNIDADPLLVAPGSVPGHATLSDANFRLRPDSPCIDAGNNAVVPREVATDLDGATRIRRGFVDMGADEFVASDFDADGDTDLDDYRILQHCFNGPNRPPRAGCAVNADLDGDMDVDSADFRAFQGCFNGQARSSRCPS